MGCEVPVRRRAILAIAVAAVCLLAYLSAQRASPIWDTIPARLVPFSLLRSGDLDLDEFGWLQNLHPLPYFLVRAPSGRLTSIYPVAIPLVVTPVAAPLYWWTVARGIDPDDVRFRLATVIAERLAAALVAAVSVAVTLCALTRLTSVTTAVLMALVYGVGTNVWSVSSQALWQHGFVNLALAGITYCLIRPDSVWAIAAAGAFAAFGMAVRPTAAIFAGLALLFVWSERRRWVGAFVALPVAVGVAGLAYNVSSTGMALRGYSGFSPQWPGIGRLMGLLVSPSRGLLVFTPVALLAVPGMVRWRTVRPRWLAYLAAGVVANLVLYSTFEGWWGGHTYGPRYLTDILPALAVLAVPAVDRLKALGWGRIVLGGLALWGIGIQVVGAHWDYDHWNHHPVSVDRYPARLWDWGDWQVTGALRAGWRGGDLLPLFAQAWADPRPALLRPLTGRDLAGSLDVQALSPLRLRAGTFGHVAVRVVNHGSVVWPAFSDYGGLDCCLAYLWRRDGQTLSDVGGSRNPPRNLGPGESAEFDLRVDVPHQPGSYELDLALVQMLDLDRAMSGGVTARVPVVVE